MLTQSEAILDGLRRQGKRVFASWRALLVLQQATQRLRDEERRWSNLPQTIQDILPTLRAMQRNGLIEQVKDVAGIYTLPVQPPPSEEEIAQECYPRSALSHAAAIQFHRLTESFFTEIHLIVPAGSVDQEPLGLLARDLELLGDIRVKTPAKLGRRPLFWHRRNARDWFGVRDFYGAGLTWRVTDVERTLIDAIEKPDWSGGIGSVLQAWRLASAAWNLDRLIEYVDRLGSPLGRQRAGFLIETLGQAHKRLEEWARAATRGGANKLVASAAYAPTFSERWKISLNASLEALEEAQS